MSNTLFLEEKLFGAQEETKRNLDALVASCGKHPTEEDEEKIITLKIKLDTLQKIALINSLVEYGESSTELEKMCVPETPGVVHMYGCNALEYIELQRLIEVSLVGGFATFHNEPAVFMLFRGENGALAYVHGLRYPQRNMFAAKHTGDVGMGVEQLLRSTILRPIRVGLNDFVIYSVPIFRPDTEEVSLVDIPSRVSRRLDPFKEDGFIRWEKEEVRLAIFSLFLKRGWWNK